MLLAGVLAGLGPGKSLVDCATLEAKHMKEFHAAATKKGARFLGESIVMQVFCPYHHHHRSFCPCMVISCLVLNPTLNIRERLIESGDSRLVC